MPKLVIHSREDAFDAEARQAIAGELTDFALACEALPDSPFVRSTVWTYFNCYPAGHVFMGAEPATTNVVSVEIFTLRGGLDRAAKEKLIHGATAIIGKHLGGGEPIPVYIVIHEIPEINWGIFGKVADLAGLRTSDANASAF